MPGKANGSKQESKNKNKQANKPTACGSTQKEREQRGVEKAWALRNPYDSAMIKSNWKFYCNKKIAKNFKHATHY